MDRNRIDKAQRGFFLFLLGYALLSAFGFGLFYSLIGAGRLVIISATSFAVFAVLGILNFFKINKITLFRLAIMTTLGTFYFVVLFTGGASSPAMAELFIPPLLAFFYRPILDRYYFMGLTGLAIISIWPLSSYGYVENVMPVGYATTHGMIVMIYVFVIITIYTILFRYELAKKNKQLLEVLSEQRITTKKLIQSEKMASLGVMLAGVGHELNNPLNFIAGGIDGLSRQVKDSKEAKPFVDAVLEGVNRAASIVHSLGHFSRDTPSIDEHVNLHEVIDNCLVMLQSKLIYKVDVVKNYSKWPVVIVGNEGKLHQAVINIIANAEESIEKKGTIEIVTKVSRNQIRLTISDSGIGISEENLSKIGDPFFTTKAVGKGTGLGLSITYEILKLHNAEINVTSVPSKGTNFTVLFKM